MITAELLTPESFAPFGDVIQHMDTTGSIVANLGTATRTNFVTSFTNSARPSQPQAKENVCVFYAQPWTVTEGVLTPPLKMLERHPFSTQMFIPMGAQEAAYLVVVAPTQPDSLPDMAKARAFYATSQQGINYHAGTWHHPMIALNHPITFTCVVWENGLLDQDCQITQLVEFSVLLSQVSCSDKDR